MLADNFSEIGNCTGPAPKQSTMAALFVASSILLDRSAHKKVLDAVQNASGSGI
jgi:hypothetical protein